MKALFFLLKYGFVVGLIDGEILGLADANWRGACLRCDFDARPPLLSSRRKDPRELRGHGISFPRWRWEALNTSRVAVVTLHVRLLGSDGRATYRRLAAAVTPALCP